MMKWNIVLILILSLGKLTSLMADDDMHRLPMDLHDLRLSAQQHKSVEKAMKEYQTAYRRYHRQNQKIQQELSTLFLNPVFDEDDFRAKNFELERNSIEIRTQLFAKLHKILTAEQKQRFITHMQEWEIE